MDEILFQGNSKRAELDRLQSEIAQLIEESRRIERAAFAPEDVRARIRAAIERASSSGYAKRSLTRFARYTVEARADLPALDWAGLALILGPQELEQRILALCEAEPGERGLPLEKREKVLTDLRAKIEALEVEEEREVLRLRAGGHRVARRAEADPRLLMRIWNEHDTPARAARA